MRPFALVALLLGTPAAAQDLLDQNAAMGEYRSAYVLFGMGRMSYDWDAMVIQTDAMLTSLTGTWINAGQLSAGPDFNVAFWAEACERTPYRVERRGTLGFAIIRSTPQGESYTIDYRYITGRSFQISVDPDELTDFLRIPDDQRPYQSSYSGGASYGFVSVFHPSPMTMVIQPMVGIADIYVRCP